MFNFNNTAHSEGLDARIAELLEELDALTGSTDEYTTTAANLAKLMELKNQSIKTGNESAKIEYDRDAECDKIRIEDAKFAAEQEKERSWKPSPDAVVGAAASIVGILFVLHYEKANVIASKALGFIGKLKN